MKNKSPISFTLIILIICQFLIASKANAESNLLIELNEQLSQHSRAFKNNSSDLQIESDFQRAANQWLKEAKTLPQDSRDFAFARAQFAQEMAKDIELKLISANEAMIAAGAMTDTVGRMIDANDQESGTTSTLFNAGDDEETIRAKTAQTTGMYYAFQAMSSSQDQHMNQAFDTFNMNLQINEMAAEIDATSNANSLQNLERVSEATYFSVKAYRNGLIAKARFLKMIALKGGVQSAVDQARNFILNAIPSFKTDSAAVEGFKLFSESTQPQPVGYKSGAGKYPSLESRINALANKARQQRFK